MQVGLFSSETAGFLLVSTLPGEDPDEITLRCFKPNVRGFAIQELDFLHLAPKEVPE